ncbi:MAG: hypothetical protein QF893_03740 [Alphaproteobacteria bacterium]|jgi:hypothetical protein|nr:hypothetical protein [Alphaproteobacteria bacterium]
MTVSALTPSPLNRPEFAATAAETDSPDTIAAESDGKNFWGADGFTFADLIDLVNPLHHIPVVGTLYRSMTGDEIAPAARLAGGALFGGPMGFASAVMAQAVEDATGKDPGAHAVAFFTGDEQADEPAPRIAATSEASAVAVAAAAAAVEKPGPGPVASPKTRATPSPGTPAASPERLGRVAPTELPAENLGAVVQPKQAFTRQRPPTQATGDGEARQPAAVTPKLSPQAFEALMRAVGGQPTPKSGTLSAPAAPKSQAPLPKTSFGAFRANWATPPSSATATALEQRRAALELHGLLARHGKDGVPGIAESKPETSPKS